MEINHLQLKLIESCRNKKLSVEQTLSTLIAQRDLCIKMTEHADEVFARKTFKKSVMVITNYGGTQRTSRQDVISQLKSFEDGFIYSLTPSEITMMTNMIFWSMEEGVPSAMKFLGYFRKLLAFVLKHKDVIEFVNPLNNFPVVLRVYEEESISLSYKVHGKTLTSRINKKTSTTNKRKTTSSSVPSIIHSADAALLHLIKHGMLEADMAYIHDSVGVHPNNIECTKTAVTNSLLAVAKSEYFENLKDQLLDGIPPEAVPDELKHVPTEDTWDTWEEDLKTAYNAYM
ncbi:DNA-directed RNA polymerase [Pantoea sp. GABEPS69]|uniref:DNA-directed RNA polymerase n=1 Tax=Pantoea sp. GABEPS69 TaxID=3028805 RepID=UPI0038928143